MNNRYQKAMDRLHMSSSAKQRLIQSLTAPAAKTDTAYRRAMDTRRLSPEKKRQIIKACLIHKNRLEKRRRYLHYTANAAACFLLVTAAAPVLRQLTPTLPPPASSPAVQPAEATPDSHTAAAVQASPAPAAVQAASPSPKPKASSKTPAASARAFTASSPSEPPAAPPKATALPEKTVNASHPPIAMQTPVPPTPEPSANAVSDAPDAAINHCTPSPTRPPAQLPGAGASTAPSPSEPPVQIGSPIQSFPSQTALEEQLTFPLYAPAYLPEGYRPSGFSLIGGSLAEITYHNGADTLLFRCREGSGDCSGHYEIYAHIKEGYTGNTAVTLKTDESLGFLAIWEDEAMSYALAGNQLLKEEEILKIIQSAIPSIAAD